MTRTIEIMNPQAVLLDIKDLTRDTGKYWYWDDNYHHTKKMIAPIMKMHVEYFKRIKAASYEELQTWKPVCERVDTTKFPYFKISMEHDKNWRYPFTCYQGQQMTGNGRTIFSIRHAPDVPKVCVTIFDFEVQISGLRRLYTLTNLVDCIENTPYWKEQLASKIDRSRVWRLVYTPDLGLYWIDCIFAESMEGDWFHSPSGHDQAVWDMTINVIKRFGDFNQENVLDVIDVLINEGVPLIKNWNPKDF